MSKQKMQRLAFDFSKEAVEELDTLMENAGQTTLADLIRDALKLYQFAVERREQGWELLVREKGDDNDVRETMIINF